MKKFKELIATLIFDKEWKWLEKLISLLCYIELAPKTIHCFAPGKVSGNLRKIPEGIYCYANKHICPFGTQAKWLGSFMENSPLAIATYLEKVTLILTL